MLASTTVGVAVHTGGHYLDSVRMFHMRSSLRSDTEETKSVCTL